MKLSNIRLLVKDFDKSFTFYNDTIGLECNWGKPGENFASFNVGIPSALTIFKAELMDIDINTSETKTSDALTDKIMIVIEVKNMEETFKDLEQKGVKFLSEPKNMLIWGIRVAHFRDPDNNLIELYTDLP